MLTDSCRVHTVLKCGAAHNNNAKSEALYTATNIRSYTTHWNSLNSRQWDECPQPSVIANCEVTLPGVKSHTLCAVTAPEESRWWFLILWFLWRTFMEQSVQYEKHVAQFTNLKVGLVRNKYENIWLNYIFDMSVCCVFLMATRLCGL